MPARFPAANEATVAARIGELFDLLTPDAVVTAAAGGSDLLVVEAARNAASPSTCCCRSTASGSAPCPSTTRAHDG